MFNIIDTYMSKLSINDVNTFLNNNDIHLSNEELEYTYTFIKKNYKDILSNPNVFNIDKYKDHYSIENFNKIKHLYNVYYQKYHSFFN